MMIPKPPVSDKASISDASVPRAGDEKVKQFFAFLPVYARGKRRWLQRVRVRYVYEVRDNKSGWKAVKFLDSPGVEGFVSTLLNPSTVFALTSFLLGILLGIVGTMAIRPRTEKENDKQWPVEMVHQQSVALAGGRPVDTEPGQPAEPEIAEATAPESGPNAESDTAKSDTTKSDTTKSDTAKIDTTKSDTAKSDTTKSDTAKIDTTKGDTAKIDSVKNVNVQSEIAASGAARTDDIGARDSSKSEGAHTDSLVSVSAEPTPAYDGSILAGPPKEIEAADVQLVRDFLVGNLFSGQWIESAWRRIDPPLEELADYEGLDTQDAAYALTVRYKTRSSLGFELAQQLVSVFHTDRVIFAGGPLKSGKFKTLTRD